MAKTRDQMIYRVLTKLGFNTSGQSVATEDYGRVEENLEACFAQLGAEKIFYVGDYDSFDEESFDPLAEVLAAYLAEDFAQDAVKWAGRYAMAKDRLEVIAAPSGTGEPLKADPMLSAGARRYYGYGGTILG